MKRIGNSFDIDHSVIESRQIFVSELYGALSKVLSLLYVQETQHQNSFHQRKTH